MYKQEFYFTELGISLNHAEIKFSCICINLKGGGGDCATTADSANSGQLCRTEDFSEFTVYRSEWS